ncbi:hypothetical protein Tco_0369201 [Tanacetum coccineum]
MSVLTFTDTHNVVAFLEKPDESDGFHEIIDFLNANQIHYALTVNPTIYTSCIKQFWATAKANTVNGERQLQALVDKKRVIITESSIRSDLHLEDAGGIDCLPTATIFEELARMGYEKPSERLTFYKAFFSLQWKLLIHTITQCLSAKSTAWNEFSSTMASAIICLATNQNFNFSKYIFDAMVKHLEGGVKFLIVPIPSNDPLLSGLKRLRKVGESSRVESFEDKESLGAQEDTSKQGRIKIVNETQGRLDDAEMFDTDDLHGDEVIVDMAVGEKQEKSAKIDEREVSTCVKDSVAPTILVTTVDEGVTAAKIDEITPTSAPITVIDELTLAQTLIEIKAAKPKVVTTAATTTTTRPKARGVVVQEPSEFRTTTSSPQASQPSKTKDKGKAIMIEPEVPLKRKDQVALDEEMARNLEAQLQAELIEEEKMARKKEEEANIALIESWENTQAMMEADRLLAERLQTREQEELTDEEKAKLFMEFMERRRKHFAALRAQEKRNRPPTKAQKRNQMSVYLKHMGGYKHNQLKGRSYDEIQKLGKKDKSSSKKTKIAQDSSTKRTEDNEAELKMHMVIVKDDDIAIDAIPLATKPPVIVEYKIIKEGIIGHYQLIRVDGSSKRYSSMIRMLQGIDREDLETLWKLFKTKHGNTRPEDEHERVLWGDLKVMFEPDIKSDVWRNLQGYKVTIWKLFDSCGVHFVRFRNVHIFMLVEKRYPLTPITITNILNKKLQADYWNKMCYQLLKLMVKQQKG